MVAAWKSNVVTREESVEPPLGLLNRQSADCSDEELYRFLRPLQEFLQIRNNFRSLSVNELLPRLADPEDEVRVNAAFALGEYGPKAAAACVPLIALLSDRSRPVRFAAAQALGDIGAHGEKTAPALLKSTALETIDDLWESPFFPSCLSLAKLAAHKPGLVLTLLWRDSASEEKSRRLAAALSLYQIGLRLPQLLLPSLHRCEASSLPSLQQHARVLRAALERAAPDPSA